MEKDIFFVIGNGFTANLLEKSNINSSKPLSNFNSSLIKNDFIKNMPLLIEVFNYEKSLNPDDDFKCFESIFKKQKYKCYADYEKVCCQTRRFIAFAYTQFFVTARKLINFKEWKWTNWFQEYIDRISGIYSLNYDRFVEELLLYLKVPHYRMASSEYIDLALSRNGLYFKAIPIFKPHGSIDFDAPLMNYNEKSWWNITTDLNALYWSEIPYVETIPLSYNVCEYENLLLRPRFQPDIIPPFCVNFYRDIPWVDYMYKRLKFFVSNISKLVCFGFSYSECDREEFNELLSYCNNKDLCIYDFNLSENEELKTAVENSGFKYIFHGVRSKNIFTF